MSTRDKIKAALPEAMKAKDEMGVATVRLILAALKDKDIDARGKGNADGIDEAAVLSLLQGMIKQRQESIAMYRPAGREDLAGKEEAEIKVIQRFLPQQLGDAEVKKILDTLIAELNVTSVKDMGKLMAALKTRYAGQMDMAKASGLVKERLASGG